MKKIFFLGALCLMNVALMAEDYELRTLTFEDADAKFAPYTSSMPTRPSPHGPTSWTMRSTMAHLPTPLAVFILGTTKATPS